MLRKFGILLCTIILAASFQSCKKEEDNSVHVPAQPQAPCSPIVCSVPLNGGNVIGRWTLTYEQIVEYVNDTFDSYDTMAYIPGQLMVDFRSNGDMYLYDLGDTSVWTYSVSGNQMILNDGVDIFTVNYGVQGTHMRWKLTTTDVDVNNNIIRREDDYIFERY